MSSKKARRESKDIERCIYSPVPRIDPIYVKKENGGGVLGWDKTPISNKELNFINSRKGEQMGCTCCKRFALATFKPPNPLPKKKNCQVRSYKYCGSIVCKTVRV